MRNRKFSPSPFPQAELNDHIASLYRRAWQTGPLEASIKTMSKLVDGDLHLAFITGKGGKISFDTSRGAEGTKFLMTTMAAAESHPLIYQTDRDVNAISDVLGARDWQHREMYQRARPLLKMGDSLGVDLRITPDTTFSACVIRDRRNFQDRERSNFHLMIPHLVNVLSFDQNRSMERAHFYLLPSSSLPPTRQALHRQLRKLLKPGFPSTDDLTDWIHFQREAAPDHPEFLTLSTCKVVFIPVGKQGDGSFAIRPFSNPPPSSSPHPSLTPREKEISHWMHKGKTNIEISVILGIAPGTVKRHLENIYQKLDVPNRVSAVSLLQQSGR